MIKLILKRDGSLVPFELEKIAKAIDKSFLASDCIQNYDKKIAMDLACEVVAIIENLDVGVPTVEFVQDIVEKVLIEKNYFRTAKAYILYREKRSNQRKLEVSLGSSFEQLQTYRPKNSFYSSAKDRSRILGESSLANYNQSNHFDCFVTKALEQKILKINNLAYLDDLLYQYVIDCGKIQTDDLELGLNEFFQVVMYFDKFQQGPLQLVNFDDFFSKFTVANEWLKKFALVFDNFQMFLENRLEIATGALDQTTCNLLSRNDIFFVTNVAPANIVYQIDLDAALLEKQSHDLGIDLNGLENRLKDFLNKATKQRFSDSLKVLGDYHRYLAGVTTANKLDLLNANENFVGQTLRFQKELDDQLNITCN